MPETMRPQQAPEGLVECQCPGWGRPWVIRLCQERQRADRAVVSGPIQVRRMKCLHVIVCKHSSPQGGEPKG